MNLPQPLTTSSSLPSAAHNHNPSPRPTPHLPGLDHRRPHLRMRRPLPRRARLALPDLRGPVLLVLPAGTAEISHRTVLRHGVDVASRTVDHLVVGQLRMRVACGRVRRAVLSRRDAAAVAVAADVLWDVSDYVPGVRIREPGAARGGYRVCRFHGGRDRGDAGVPVCEGAGGEEFGRGDAGGL